MVTGYSDVRSRAHWVPSRAGWGAKSRRRLWCLPTRHDYAARVRRRRELRLMPSIGSPDDVSAKETKKLWRLRCVGDEDVETAEELLFASRRESHVRPSVAASEGSRAKCVTVERSVEAKASVRGQPRPTPTRPGSLPACSARIPPVNECIIAARCRPGKPTTATRPPSFLLAVFLRDSDVLTADC